MTELFTAFTLFVATSFLWFSRGWITHVHRWHIGLMSTSYTLLCLTVLFTGPEFNIASTWLAASAMAVGFAGLLQYWLAE